MATETGRYTKEMMLVGRLAWMESMGNGERQLGLHVSRARPFVMSRTQPTLAARVNNEATIVPTLAAAKGAAGRIASPWFKPAFAGLVQPRERDRSPIWQGGWVKVVLSLAVLLDSSRRLNRGTVVCPYLQVHRVQNL